MTGRPVTPPVWSWDSQFGSAVPMREVQWAWDPKRGAYAPVNAESQVAFTDVANYGGEGFATFGDDRGQGEDPQAGLAARPVRTLGTAGGSFCAFVSGQRGQEKIVVCDVEGLPDWQKGAGEDWTWDGQAVVRAIQGRCPECKTPFRVNPEKSPCAVAVREAVFARKDGPPVKFRPVTIYIPVQCGAQVVAIGDQGEIQGHGVCSWHVIIRRGRAVPIEVVLQALPQAIAAAQGEWSRAAEGIQREEKRGRDMRQWKAALDKVWTDAIPSMQAIQSGNYERGGPTSLVGAWDQVEHVIASCCALQQQLAQMR